MKRNYLFVFVLLLFMSDFSLVLAQTQYETVVFHAGENGVNTYRIPAIVTTKSGKVIAFAEARHNSRSDTGDIDLVMKESLDGGKTWSEARTVWDDAGNVCGNPCPVVDRRTGRIILLSTWNNGKDPEKKIHDRTAIDTRRVFVMYSDNEGKTWSKPKDITSSTKRDNWTWYATGPCHAIQLKSGRIVVPCNHGIFEDGKAAGTASHVIYSDDGGKTWHIGADAGVGNESTVVELGNGDVMLNMRSWRRDREETGYARIVAVSHDEGLTFDEPYFERALIEPVCNASIINYDDTSLLFSNPEHKEKRKNLTVRMSRDSGKTWERICTVTEGPTAYSDLVVFPDGDAGVLFESGKTMSYENISFARISSSAFKPSLDTVVRLYPKGQEVDEGIIENGVRVTEGPGESNGYTVPEESSPAGNVKYVGDEARMEFYFADKPNGQMVIVCPGGGYGNVCKRKEGFDVAKWLNKRGVSACVLVYRLPNGHTDVPMTDVRNAFRYCRSHAADWKVKQIGIMGFSAGGHLAATASTMFTDDVTRPDFSVLVYPVIDLDHHKGTRTSLVGDDEALKEKYSLQNAVTERVPVTFLALCEDDNVVDAKSSLLYYDALKAKGVKAEMIIFPTGKHGWGFYSEEPGAKDAIEAYRPVFYSALAQFLEEVKPGK